MLLKFLGIGHRQPVGAVSEAPLSRDQARLLKAARREAKRLGDEMYVHETLIPIIDRLFDSRGDQVDVGLLKITRTQTGVTIQPVMFDPYAHYGEVKVHPSDVLPALKEYYTGRGYTITAKMHPDIPEGFFSVLRIVIAP